MKMIGTFLAVCFFGIFSSSIYNQHFTALSGNEVYLSQYEGKKLLLVNIASESEYAAVQIPQLETLYQLYKDSLVVIGFFSNDYGHEPRNNTELKLLLQDTYHTTFPASQIMGVRDSTGHTHLLYQWLQMQSQNGNSNIKVKNDFQKYLISADGNIIGIFSARINPMDSTIRNAILQ